MVSYKPLFRYCLEHDITMADCRKICGISPNTWTKINKNEEVSMTILNKICKGLGVTYGDIVEYIHQEEKTEQVSYGVPHPRKKVNIRHFDGV